jgi:hypothetical protein
MIETMQMSEEPGCASAREAATTLDALRKTNLESARTALGEESLDPPLWLAIAAHCMAFALLWAGCLGMFHQFPYVASGAEVIYHAKIQIETNGVVFPKTIPGGKLIIFGNSRVLAGFVPEYFDRLARDGGLPYVSFNSGFPARAEFVPELASMVRRGQIPDVVLLTQPWRASSTFFKFAFTDFELAEKAFPFRHMIRDTSGFLANARHRGGLAQSYLLPQEKARQMLADRGYYFIAEQSHFPADSLPPGLRFPADTPNETIPRTADPASQELRDLNRILDRHHIRCFYVPDYFRIGAAAPAAAYDQKFEDLLLRNSSCRLLGPDYFSYPNEYFSDAMHLNPKGALAYTADIHRLLAQAERR